MTQRARLKILDETQKEDGRVESTTVSVETVSPTIAPLDYNETVALHNAWSTSVTAITLGRLVESEFAGNTTYTDFPAPATDPDAQRERKWKVVGRVNDGATGYPKYSRTIGTADITNKLPNQERLDPAHVSFTDLKTAWEAYVTHKGHNIIVDRVILVGANT